MISCIILCMSALDCFVLLCMILSLVSLGSYPELANRPRGLYDTTTGDEDDLLWTD